MKYVDPKERKEREAKKRWPNERQQRLALFTWAIQRKAPRSK